MGDMGSLAGGAPGSWRVADVSTVPLLCLLFVFPSRRRHTRLQGDWSSDVCSSDLGAVAVLTGAADELRATAPATAARFYAAALRLDPASGLHWRLADAQAAAGDPAAARSEERRGGEECRFRWSPDQ